VYTKIRLAALPKSFSRDNWRDGVRCADSVDDNDDDVSSFELAEGLVTRGLLFVLLLPLPLSALMLPWKGTAWAHRRSVASGVCAIRRCGRPHVTG
jgi:hypothetical protein